MKTRRSSTSDLVESVAAVSSEALEAKETRLREMLAVERRAQRQRHQRIDVGVARGDRDRRVREQVQVRGVRHQRSEDDQVGDRSDGPSGDDRRQALAVDQAEDDEDQPGGEHLRPRGHHSLRQVEPPAPQRAEGP